MVAKLEEGMENRMGPGIECLGTQYCMFEGNETEPVFGEFCPSHVSTIVFSVKCATNCWKAAFSWIKKEIFETGL